MINLDEQIVTIAQAAAIFPHRPRRATVWRWTKHGHSGVKLETLRIAGRVFTSREAIERFIAASNGGQLANSVASIARRAEKHAARAACDAAGL